MFWRRTATSLVLLVATIAAAALVYPRFHRLPSPERTLTSGRSLSVASADGPDPLALGSFAAAVPAKANAEGLPTMPSNRARGLLPSRPVPPARPRAAGPVHKKGAAETAQEVEDEPLVPMLDMLWTILNPPGHNKLRTVPPDTDDAKQEMDALPSTRLYEALELDGGAANFTLLDFGSQDGMPYVCSKCTAYVCMHDAACVYDPFRQRCVFQVVSA
jgi:hypothetical protein